MRSPIANVCSLDGDELRERARRWSELRKRALLGASHTGEGAEFRYTRSPDTENEVRELVAAERECCAVDGIRWELDCTDEELVMSVAIPPTLHDSREAKLIFGLIGGK